MTKQGVRNVCFLEKLACFVFLLPSFWDSPFCHITEDIAFKYTVKFVVILLTIKSKPKQKKQPELKKILHLPRISRDDSSCYNNPIQLGIDIILWKVFSKIILHTITIKSV